MRARAGGLIACALVALAGCVERRIEITSEPSGALVRVAGKEVGRTPLDVGYTFHGWHDVELELDGYEPLMTTALARTPWWENPGPDLVAELWPGRIDNVQRWHFVLEPRVEQAEGEDAERALIERASAMRAELGPVTPPPDSTEPGQPGAQ